MQNLTVVSKAVIFFCVVTAFLSGVSFDYYFGSKPDDWIHDSAIVYQHRAQWKYAGIVTLDHGVPYSVGRKQALPLFARATERLIEAGAKGVFLDARVSREQELRMPYARCIDKDGSVQWSEPACHVTANKQCQINSSELAIAPLKMKQQAIHSFRLAPYLNQDSNLPDFLLFGWQAAESIPAGGLQVSDRLVTYDSPVARWLDLSADHAAYSLVEFSQVDNISTIYQRHPSDQVCNSFYPCRKIRLSLPSYKVDLHSQQLILPVSLLALCDTRQAIQTAALLKGKVVVLQATAPDEASDLVVTPMTTALFGPKQMTPGAQFLVDAVETLLNQDAPRAPPYPVKLLLFACVAMASVMAGIYLQQRTVWCLGLLVVMVHGSLCFANRVIQLWPVSATMLTYLVGAGQMLVVYFLMGFKQAHLVRKYIPYQIYNMLISLRKNEAFRDMRCHVVVLMSDLAGYTTVTGLLKEPGVVLAMMNDYLEQTSYVLQKKYDGILENYVGDMVCYYWKEANKSEREAMYQSALLGALELSQLQKQFFLNLPEKYRNKIDTETLKQINKIIDAGIGVTAGNVVMGDLGPRQGVKKFGILGDPLNLAARIESLTRLFNTDIIISGDLLNTVESSGLVARRLGTIRVKGRIKPETLYALGRLDDPRFDSEHIECWLQWLTMIESAALTHVTCPDCYSKDQRTILDWLKRGLLGSDGVWYLDEK